MPPIKRRDFIAGTVAAGLLPLLPGCGDSGSAGGGTGTDATAPSTTAPGLRAAFQHGVASGDPLTTAVILWTRATPLDDSAAAVPVDWDIADDAAFARIVQSGRATATSDTDHTVKVDVQGLAPGHVYYYRFKSGAATSPIGRTRTAPQGTVDRLRFAVVTCAKYSSGFYNAYRRVAERSDLQAVVHLGDYIYEDGSTDGARPQLPAHELLSLADYRTRYATQRQDADLQEVHRQHPMIWVWDDHEVANNAWKGGAEAHDPATEGDYSVRRTVAFEAAREWMPIRLPDPSNPVRIYRGFEFGDLVDLTMLDTRHIARDQQAPPNTPGGATTGAFTQTGAFTDPAREMIGTAQQAWLTDRMKTATARWRLIGNQIIFSPLKLVGAPRSLAAASVFLSNDKWDGYEPARDRAMAGFNGIKNLVVLTGDAHEAYAFDITPDPNNPLAYTGLTGSGSMGVEFVTTSVTTRGDGSVGNSLSAVITRTGQDAQQLLRVTNPHLKYYQNTLNGYVLLDVLPERVQAEFWFVPMVGTSVPGETCDAVFITTDGSNHLTTGGDPSTPISGAPSPAP